jgi:hypothetical protein
MKLVDIDSETLSIPNTDYDACVTMPSSQFTRPQKTGAAYPWFAPTSREDFPRKQRVSNRLKYDIHPSFQFSYPEVDESRIVSLQISES